MLLLLTYHLENQEVNKIILKSFSILRYESPRYPVSQQLRVDLEFTNVDVRLKGRYDYTAAGVVYVIASNAVTMRRRNRS